MVMVQLEYISTPDCPGFTERNWFCPPMDEETCTDVTGCEESGPMIMSEKE